MIVEPARNTEMVVATLELERPDEAHDREQAVFCSTPIRVKSSHS